MKPRPDWLAPRLPRDRLLRVKLGERAWDVLYQWANDVKLDVPEVAAQILEHVLLDEPD